LHPPEIVRAFSTGKKGELRINLRNFFPKAVRTHAFEYSLDQGASWKNGEYNSNRTFVVNGLPHAAEMWIHVKSLGSGAAKSGWSEPMVVAVL